MFPVITIFVAALAAPLAGVNEVMVGGVSTTNSSEVVRKPVVFTLTRPCTAVAGTTTLSAVAERPAKTAAATVVPVAVVKVTVLAAVKPVPTRVIVEPRVARTGTVKLRRIGVVPTV